MARGYVPDIATAGPQIEKNLIKTNTSLKVLFALFCYNPTQAKSGEPRALRGVAKFPWHKNLREALTPPDRVCKLRRAGIGAIYAWQLLGQGHAFAYQGLPYGPWFEFGWTFSQSCMPDRAVAGVAAWTRQAVEAA